MHRLKLPIGLLCALALAGPGCASDKQQVPDPPRVEMIRLQITKVRNAIDETRSTIANSRGATYLPELYVRLAELLSEEARYHYQLAYEREQRSSRVLHVPQVRLLKDKAIEVYELVLERFPNTPLADRVLFNIGHEHRELGNFDKMRSVLNRLADNYPNSSLRSDALLVLGDYHFDRNELGSAKNYYDKIVEGPLYRVSGLGHYKRAWVWVNSGDCEKALNDFERALKRSKQWEELEIEAAQAQNPSEVDGLTKTPNNTPVLMAQQDIDVRRESLVDLTYCYSRKRKSKNALRYLQTRAYNRDTYIAALDKLASRYRTVDEFTGAVLVTRELLELGPSDQLRIDDARTLHTALKRTKDYSKVDLDMKLIAQTLTRHYSRLDMTPEARSKLVEEFEVYMRDLATSAQAKMEKLKGKRRLKAASNLARGYEYYLETFPDETSEQLPQMLLNASDVFSIAGRDLDAGLRSIQAANLLAKEKDKEKREALYDAIVSLQTSLEKEDGRSHYERVTARAAMRQAGTKLLAMGKLSPDKNRRVKYALAQTYYDEGRFYEAIDKLTAVAYEFPKTKEGDAALQLVLDSYNTVNDNEGLMLASRRFSQSDSPASDSLKGRLKGVLAAAEQRKLDELSLQAAGEDGGDLTPLITFAQQQKGTSLGERALINAFVAARAIGDTTKMYELADELAKTYPKSEQLPGIYTALAQTAIARFEYDRAITTLTKAASVNPAQRNQLLLTSGGLKQELGDTKGALALYKQAIQGSEGQAKNQALSAYAALVEKGSTASQLARTLAPYASSGNSDVLARLGLAQVAQGKGDDAEMTFQKAQDDPGAPADAKARVSYGSAEILRVTLENYPTPDSVDLIQELIAIVEVTQQEYLNAARQGSALYTAAALSRLAGVLQQSADKIAGLKLPADLSAAEQKQVKAALDTRVKGLRAAADEALGACANQLWTSMVLNDVVIGCNKKTPWNKTLVPLETLKPRSKGGATKNLDKLRERLSKNPEDQEGLRLMAEAFLDANDPHAARLVLVRAIQQGGGPLEQNLLGVASYRAGDRAGAFTAFSMAAKGGIEAGRKNLIKVLGEAGLAEQAKKAQKQYAKGKDGGRLL